MRNGAIQGTDPVRKADLKSGPALPAFMYHHRLVRIHSGRYGDQLCNDFQRREILHIKKSDKTPYGLLTAKFTPAKKTATFL